MNDLLGARRSSREVRLRVSQMHILRTSTTYVTSHLHSSSFIDVPVETVVLTMDLTIFTRATIVSVNYLAA